MTGPAGLHIRGLGGPPMLVPAGHATTDLAARLIRAPVVQRTRILVGRSMMVREGRATRGPEGLPIVDLEVPAMTAPEVPAIQARAVELTVPRFAGNASRSPLAWL